MNPARPGDVVLRGGFLMCESACVGFAAGCVGFAAGCRVLRRYVWDLRWDVWFFGLKRRNCDLNHENLRMDLVQKKKFRLEP